MVDIRLGGNEVSQIMAGSGPSSPAAGRVQPTRPRRPRGGGASRESRPPSLSVNIHNGAAHRSPTSLCGYFYL